MSQSSTAWTDLDLRDSAALTDVGVAALAPLTSLTSLNLRGCRQITDAGLAALAPLTSLVVRR